MGPDSMFLENGDKHGTQLGLVCIRALVELLRQDGHAVGSAQKVRHRIFEQV